MLHQIPPKPLYLRAQTLRRLSRAGALPIKNSAYLLPDADDTLEDFQWIRSEVVDQGGNAWVFRAEALAGFTNQEIQDAFRQARSTEYERLRDEARDLLAEIPAGSPDGFAALNKFARRVQQVRRIDFFDAPGYRELEDLMKQLHDRLRDQTEDKPAPAERAGGVWVTRKGVKVDRISSAWLVRRFIDPQAIFRFVDPGAYRHEAGEIRFDMFEGEYTHQGGLCTFEVLLASKSDGDPSLRAIAEIIHDIDLKEQHYDRAETAGVSRMIDGICARTADDEKRIEMGCGLFDTLYESFRIRPEP